LKSLVKIFLHKYGKSIFPFARNEIPNLKSHKLNEGSCVKITPNDKLALVLSKFYDSGKILTFQLTQATKVKSYLVWKPIPFGDSTLDFFCFISLKQKLWRLKQFDSKLRKLNC